MLYLCYYYDMRSSLLTLLLCTPLLMTLPSCKDAKGTSSSATEQASIELNDIIHNLLPQLKQELLTQEEQEDIKDTERLIEQFRLTEDVNIASPRTRTTLLQLAAAYKKEELVRCLLLDGADPNAQRLSPIEGKMQPSDTVLTYAVAQGFIDPSCYDAESVLRIVNMLIAHGADMGKRGPHGLLPLEIAALSGSHEALIEQLYKLTPQEAISPPISEEKRCAILYLSLVWHYDHILEQLIALGHSPNTRMLEGRTLLMQAASSSLMDEGDGWKSIIDILLKHGADINLTDNQGKTALYDLAFAAQRQTPDENKEMDIASRIIFLLERGARTDIAIGEDEEYPGFSAYDLLSLRPSLLEELARRGFDLEAPPLTLPEEDTALLATLCRATVTGRDITPLKKDFDRIAAILLTPSNAMLHHELYETALKSALSILLQLDEKKARDIIYQLPIWEDELAGSSHLHCTSCSSCGGESHILRPILDAIAGQEGFIIPSERILHLAHALVKSEQEPLALACLKLLARCPDYQAIATKLAESENATLQLGALYAQCMAHDIPLPEEHAVQIWLADHSRVANTNFLKKALLLTSLEELWFGDMPEQEITSLLSTMEEIGAKQAADQYRRIIPMLENPEKLDEIMAGDQLWERDLKVAIAEYFIKNAAQFHPNSLP